MCEEKYQPLASRLLFGRPRWKLLLEEIGKANKQWVHFECTWMKNDLCIFTDITSVSVCGFSKRVGVFCCGPKGISRTLHRLCNSSRSSETVFEFNKESFSWSDIRSGSTLKLTKTNFETLRWIIWSKLGITLIDLGDTSQKNINIHRLHLCFMFTKGPTGTWTCSTRPVSLDRPHGSQLWALQEPEHLIWPSWDNLKKVAHSVHSWRLYFTEYAAHTSRQRDYSSGNTLAVQDWTETRGMKLAVKVYQTSYVKVNTRLAHINIDQIWWQTKAPICCHSRLVFLCPPLL